MKEADYEAWKNDRVAVMFDFDDDFDSDGGDSDGFLSTWGNFSANSLKVSTCPIQNKLEENTKILRDWIKDSEEKGWSHPDFKALVDEYEKTGVFTDEMYKTFPALYYSREEYKEMLLRGDCESPFFYRGEGVVVIGYYFHS
jgi:hypothetical protein